MNYRNNMCGLYEPKIPCPLSRVAATEVGESPAAQRVAVSVGTCVPARKALPEGLPHHGLNKPSSLTFINARVTLI